jgi:hypothetical protein
VYGTADSTITLRNTTVADSDAAYGGGVYSEGNLTINDCTFYGNTGTTTVAHSTHALTTQISNLAICCRYCVYTRA